MQKRVVQTSGIEVGLEKEATEEIVQILQSTTYGIEGRLRYSHVDTQDRIKATQNLSFFQIKRYQRILGIAGVIKRSTLGVKGTVTALYIRYLSMPGAFKKKPTSRIGHKPKQGVLRGFLSDMFTQLEQDVPDEEKAVFYAVVERDNIPSQNMCKMNGFEKVRQMDTHLFSRFKPREHAYIRAIKEVDQPEFEKQLFEFYQKHTLVFTDTLFTEGKCMVAERDGKIVGGIKGRPVKWELLEVPGFSGFLMLKVLPYVPYLKRLFDKRYVRFVALEALWVSEGYEKEIEPLMEAMCAYYKEHIGILWSDSESPIAHLIRKFVVLGFMSKVQKNVPADLLIRFIDTPDEEKKVYRNSPMYISAGDMT